jgi:hypothetical protein
MPKSTTKLNPGDCCLIRCDDESFVPFVFVCGVKGKRSSFYGAIVKSKLRSSDLSDLPDKVTLGEWALVHIQSYAKNGTPVIGNIANQVSVKALRNIENMAIDHSVGSRQGVWGHRTIIKVE